MCCRGLASVGTRTPERARGNIRGPRGRTTAAARIHLLTKTKGPGPVCVRLARARARSNAETTRGSRAQRSAAGLHAHTFMRATKAHEGRTMLRPNLCGQSGGRVRDSWTGQIACVECLCEIGANKNRHEHDTIDSCSYTQTHAR